MGKSFFTPCAVILAYTLIILSIAAGDEAPQVNSYNNTGTNLKAEDEAPAYLAQVNTDYSKACNKEMTSRWKYITNVTKENEDESVAALTEFLAFQASVQKDILDRFSDWHSYTDPEIKRQFQFYSIMGPGNMDPALVDEMNKLTAKMESVYASTKVCSYETPTNCTLRLEPEIEEKLRTAENFDELAWYWTSWHDAMSKAVSTADYKRFMELQNLMAKEAGYDNMGDLWAAPYDDGTTGWTARQFEQQMIDIWETLRPYYNKLHAYVRMKLRKNPLYAEKITKLGLLPANLMGNMWAQDWTALDAKTKPFPNAPSLDATAAMIKAGYTQQKMFEVADKFFQDLGLEKMTQTFWDNSMILRPEDGREVVCHASAEDFCLGANSTDFRIKMCTNVNQEDLVTVHHEMGHIEYFMQYADKNYIFRDGANPGFHEAIGDALALAVTTPKHMVCVLGLPLDAQIDCSKETGTNAEVTETDINFLYHMALEKFSFFPFAISMDSWRWGVFDGSIPESEYNRKWWEIRQKNQGIEPPSPRSDTGFDPSAKYHIVANVEYIRYFISHILQFQFYEAMCVEAKEFDPTNPNSKPLYQCDFDGNKEAGKKFGDMMKLGFSQPWPIALESLTNSPSMNTTALINYFMPLFKHMENELMENNEEIGFGVEFQEQLAQEYLDGFYEQEASYYCNLASVTQFNYQTDLTNMEAEQAAMDAGVEWSNFALRELTGNLSIFEHEQFTNKNLSRQITFIKAIGTSALDAEDLQRFNNLVKVMSRTHSTAKICPFTKVNCDVNDEGLSLDPDLTEIFGALDDYDEMAYLWQAWRDATGKKMRTLYPEYVELSNQAAVINGYDNMADFWLLRYESETFRQDMENLWQDARTQLYEPLYNFVRHRLAKNFTQMNPSSMIPAHVLGNMWSETWENVLPLVLPHPTAAPFDVTDLLRQSVDWPQYPSELAKIRELYNYANNFLKSLGLADMKMAYGDKALVLNPEEEGREINCEPSTWDMCDGMDFRVKMCTQINHTDFITLHRMMGQIAYHVQYKDLPFSQRAGANPGFVEAIGNVVALSVETPAHMSILGLSYNPTESPETMLNHLMEMALDKIAFLPFGYLVDSYRWKIFDGQIPSKNLTYDWLKMSAQYQGIVPPVKRNEEDFDAGATKQVSSNSPAINSFVSNILQFQLHKRLCEAAGKYPANPLHECDVYNKMQAGKIFGDIIKAGGSQTWQDLLESVTGNRTLDVTPMVEYFQPLLDFLDEQSQAENYPMSWDWKEFENFYEPPETEEEQNTTEQQKKDDGLNTATVVVGVILAVSVTVIIVGYFVIQKIRGRKST